MAPRQSRVKTFSRKNNSVDLGNPGKKILAIAGQLRRPDFAHWPRYRS